MQPFSIHEVGAAAMLPPRSITISQWADENRVLTGGAAADLHNIFAVDEKKRVLRYNRGTTSVR